MPLHDRTACCRASQPHGAEARHPDPVRRGLARKPHRGAHLAQARAGVIQRQATGRMLALTNTIAVAHRVAIGPGHAGIHAQQQLPAQRLAPANAHRNLEAALAAQDITQQPRLQLDGARQVIAHPQPADQRTAQWLQPLGQILLVHIPAAVDRQPQPETEAVHMPQGSGQPRFRHPAVVTGTGPCHARAADRIAPPADPGRRCKGVPHLPRAAVFR